MPVELVSCIITAYNYERFIVEALESVLAQDYPAGALEVIAVDDGSTDRTPELLEPYADRITYIRQDNQGVIAAVNRGFAAANGEFLALLNADDAWRPQAVRRMSDRLRARPEAGLVYCDSEIVDADGATLHPSFVHRFALPNFPGQEGEPLAGRVLGPLMRQCFTVTGSFIVRGALRKVFDPLPDVAAYEDWYIATRVAEISDVEYVDEPLLLYRHHGDNMVLFQEGDPERLSERLEKDVRFRRWMLQNVKEETVTPGDLVGAYAALQRDVTLLAEASGVPFSQALAVTETERSQAALAVRAGRDALDRDPRAATFCFAHALGMDPYDDGAREAFVAVAREALVADGGSNEQVDELDALAAQRAPLGIELVRGVDRDRRRHVYGLGTSPPGQLVAQLGALHLQPRHGSVGVWLTDDGYLVTARYRPARARPGLARTMRWVAAPLGWRDFGHRAGRARAFLRRVLEAPRALGRRLEVDRPTAEPIGYLLPDPPAGGVPLNSAIHPVLPDQLLTSYATEATDMGYADVTLLGYLDGPRRVEVGSYTAVPWASHFGLRARREPTSK